MGVTDKQLQIAKALGVDVLGDSEAVAAARILDTVAEAVGERAKQPATDKQIHYGQQLGLDLCGDSLRVASARIDDEFRRRNFEAIGRMQLKPGDHVLKRSAVEVNNERCESIREFVVSSIQPNSRVFFKGGNGQGAWPTQLEKIKNKGS